MTDFYLTLPSNSNVSNSTCKFSTRLPRKIELKGSWEVALVEIQYPYSWNNIFGQQGNEAGDNWLDVVFHNNFIATIFVPPGYYGTIHELLDAIEYGKARASESLLNRLKQEEAPPKEKNDYEPLPKHIKAVKRGFHLTYDETLKRVRLKRFPKRVKHIELSRRLQYMLGFEDSGLFKDKDVARYTPDLRGGFYSLHVYCDLVEPQIVGDSLVPLLRCVHVEGNHGDIVEKMFESPHYIPVLPSEISQVSVEIKDDRNQFVPFDFGKVVVKLHFKKKRLTL